MNTALHFEVVSVVARSPIHPPTQADRLSVRSTRQPTVQYIERESILYRELKAMSCCCLILLRQQVQEEQCFVLCLAIGEEVNEAVLLNILHMTMVDWHRHHKPKKNLRGDHPHWPLKLLPALDLDSPV